jgi:hypothetical protein
MPKPPRMTSALMFERELIQYIHVTKRNFRRQGWTESEEWRVVLHPDPNCPRPAGVSGVLCTCNQLGGCDIRHLKRKSPGG